MYSFDTLSTSSSRFSASRLIRPAKASRCLSSTPFPLSLPLASDSFTVYEVCFVTVSTVPASLVTVSISPLAQVGHIFTTPGLSSRLWCLDWLTILIQIVLLTEVFNCGFSRIVHSAINLRLRLNPGNCGFKLRLFFYSLAQMIGSLSKTSL